MTFDASHLATLYFLSEWAIRIVMLAIVPFRRTPDAARGWLVLIFFLPWPGLLLYLLIGRAKYPQWRLERLDALPGLVAPVRERLLAMPHVSRSDRIPQFDQYVTLATRLGHLPVLSGNEAELLDDYAASVDRLVADIDAAQQHVHLLYYIFADDATGTRVAEALGRAVRRGVTCRVLVDALGSKRWARGTMAMLESRGVEVHLVLPIGLFRRHRARLDLRNHRKIAVIDGQVGYTGSQNLVNLDFKPNIVNQEMVVRVRGPIVLELQMVFVADWLLETDQMLEIESAFPAPTVCGSVKAQAVASGPDFPTMNVQRLTVALVHAAHRRVVLTTPYFIPDEPLLQALQTAVLRGVEVHLVVSQVADQALVSLAQRSYYGELLAAGVQIHRFGPHFLHAKHVSIDEDIALIGSSNMDIRSFMLNSEITLMFYDSEVTRELQRREEGYFARSELLTEEVWRERQFSSKVLENLARLFSPLL